MPLKLYSCAKCMAPFKENSDLVMDNGAGLWCPRCTYQATYSRCLREELPKEFFIEHMAVCPPRWASVGKERLSPAAEQLDVRVITKHSRVRDDNGFKEWPGKQKDVHVWWELENGKAVGWNESPSKGWSFPVITLHNLKVWNGRGDYGYNGLDGRLYVCAATKKRAVELLQKAGHIRMNMHEFTGYYASCWGIGMQHVKREEGVWFTPENEDDVMGGYRPRRLL
jgi:DNA-directed RNA polymerase subunit RPC12/RpoP